MRTSFIDCKTEFLEKSLKSEDFKSRKVNLLAVIAHANWRLDFDFFINAIDHICHFKQFERSFSIGFKSNCLWSKPDSDEACH